VLPGGMAEQADREWLTLTDGESVVWSGQPRRRSVLKVALLAVVLVVGAGVVRLLYGLAALPLAVLLVGYVYLRIVNTEYVLTDRSVYRRTGVAGETVERASLAKVQNVDFTKGVLGSQFDFGTVDVSTAGGSEVRIANVNDPGEVKRKLDEYAKRSEGTGMDAAATPTGGAAVDPAEVERLREEARQLRAVAESLEETFGGDT
jgi:uncharacterized membrane protein YdbT with pleckstrin-like domain